VLISNTDALATSRQGTLGKAVFAAQRVAPDIAQERYASLQ
jgi:hypothetical protein